ncbi:hypothetical protein [Bosea massiliensis]|jgi:hypothetical protein|uniref:Uncharacterized protein n=1 Tax=Bosea massiliensis TaxID=151419 RepID=A0ABW0P3M0_9HYPH
MAATFELDQAVFEQPQGNVRGFLLAMVTYSNGKSKRLAHSYLLTDSVPDISMDLPKSIAPADVAVVAEALLAFQARLAELNTP